MNKRLFLLLSMLVVLSMLFAACGQTTEEPTMEPMPDVEKTDEPQAPATLYNEAPMLTEKVIAGDLPPVDDRLPKNPTIIEPVESIGEYGGTFHAVTWWGEGGNILMWLYDPPIRWKADLTGYEPGLATYEWSDDGMTFTMHFKEGMRWSDGEPFTMEDIQFWWEDMAKNEDVKFNTIPWYMYKSDGVTPIDMEFPDDYTWVWKSDQAMWVSPYILAQGFWEWRPIMLAKHFLEPYHPTYNADATFEELEEMSRLHTSAGMPCLFAWCLEEYTAGESWLWARNPYYWKVDTAGNQLPYVDYIQVELVEDKEVRTLNVSQGKYEVTFRGSDDPRDIPFLAEQAESGDYQLWPGWMNGAGAWPGWLINQNYAGDEPEAEEIRELLQNKWFRKGLSVSLDRQRFIDVVWEGIGTPKQATISPQSWHFAEETGEGPAVFEEWSQADAEYDAAKADEYFEMANFVDQDGDGWRDLPSGKPFQMILDLGDWGGEIVSTDSTEVAKEMWEAVGINVLVNNLVGQPDWDLRQTQGLYMLRNCHASEVDIWTYPDWIFPLRDNRAWPLEGKYRQTGGTEGWEPEVGSPAARLQNLYDIGMRTASAQERHEIVWEAIRIHIDEGPFTLGVAGDQPMPVVVKNGVRNVVTYGVLGPWAPASPGNVNPEQWWMEESLR
jgi:peptide/nickel transport system substrate-binding protein